MYAIDHAAAPSSDELWAYATALFALGDALDALIDAGVVVQELIAETTWRSQGVRVLQQRLAELRSELTAETSTLGALRWEVERSLS